MALSDLFSGDGNTNWGDVATGLTGLFGNLQGYNTAQNINQGTQNLLGAGAGNMAALQGQLGQNQALAGQAYNTARGNVDTQNQGLERDIGTMTSNLQALSDPNSPYMQMARQSIERKDAAAGRRSQWGERETQLAAQLADYVGKYSPGMQSAITNARNQINQNNQGLASIFGTMNNPNSSGQNSLQQMLQQQLTAQNSARAAQNSQTNNMTGLLNGGIKTIGGLFGNGSGAGSNYGLNSLFNWGGDTGMGALNGLTGMGSQDLFGYGQGYYDNPAFGTVSGTGDPYSSWDGSSGASSWDGGGSVGADDIW